MNRWTRNALVIVVAIGGLPLLAMQDPPPAQQPELLDRAVARFAESPSWSADLTVAIASGNLTFDFKGAAAAAPNRFNASARGERFGSSLELRWSSDAAAAWIERRNERSLQIEKFPLSNAEAPTRRFQAMGLPPHLGPLSGSPSDWAAFAERYTIEETDPEQIDGRRARRFLAQPRAPELPRFTLWIDEADALPLKIQTQYPSESVTVSFADFVFGDSARPVGEPYAAPAGAEPVEIARDRPRDASLVASLARLLANPHPAETNSLNQGRLLYLRQCMECHGVDGRAMDNFEFKAGDLTKPDTWKHGATPGETYVSIYKGASASMPPFKDLIDENRIWHLVNYVQSLKRDR